MNQLKSNPFSKVRSLLSGQSREEFGFGQRHPVSKQIAEGIRFHLDGMAKTDFAEYTFERRRSNYPTAKSDIVVYDPSGISVIRGREFSEGGHSLVFWRDEERQRVR